MAQVLVKLGISGGSSNVTIKNCIEKLQLDISHFHGQAWSKGRKLGRKISLEQYLSGKKTITSHKLRLRLLEEGIFKSECSMCELSQWLGKPIPLELDHINGNHNDNTISNLRILCPNCHTTTPTYKSKNVKR